MTFVKGYKQTNEHKRKIGISNKGRLLGKHNSPTTEFKKGQHASLITEFKKGVPNANKGGYKLSLETRKRISEGHKGEKSYQWKGNNVGYENLHKWVNKTKGKPTKCVKCHTKKAKRYVWANISGKYKRNINDWHELCNSCNLKDGVPVNKRFHRKYQKAGGN